jgi:SAM-dependent methyltransferase
MRRDVLEMRAFYASPLGAAARTMISRKVREAWGDARDLNVLVTGYATPFVDGLAERAQRVVAAMPTGQGVEAWPMGQANRACLADEADLPFSAAFFDRVLCVHALEESADPLGVLLEANRVLQPSGRVIVAVTSRHGLWANAESSPFGEGRPYSRMQLEALMREADLEPAGWTRALYVPPLQWAARWAEGFEQAGAWLWRPFAGVILMEAVKQVFAVKPRAERVRARVFAPGVLAPSPTGLAPHRQAVAPPTAANGLER